ncbi:MULTISPECIES: 2'-5' RNA ligase family protein [Sphingobacterium]|uniref:2'-5' RNA ligase family protein n=1 Tax=Sphingobacterium TaxID=28453 RepID=UPI00257D4BFE|nr:MULTISPECIES: 2'-5' RNA ligase family protein [Sphingobacterium]
MDIKNGSLIFYPNVDKIKWKERISKLFDPETEIDLNLRPHITILYGFDNSVMDLERLLIVVNNFIDNNQFSLHAEHISTFDNNPPIVKVDVIDLNGNLNKLNEILRHEFKCKVDYPRYLPHITIGTIMSPDISSKTQKINIEEFGFDNLNKGVIRYYDGVTNMIDL